MGQRPACGKLPDFTMLELTQWWNAQEFAARPWIILGKGPTFADRRRFDLSDYYSLGLNHVVREARVDVAHLIDIEVVADCAEHLLANCRWLVMPRIPSVASARGTRRLEDYFEDHPALRILSNEKRLIWYNLSHTERIGASPVIRLINFSAEPAVDLLGTLGVKKVCSLGVDGGRGYSAEFSDLEATTMFANAQTSFNRQFVEIEHIAERHGLHYAPLVEPLRIYCGTDESQRVATRVLEHSIQKQTSKPVNFEPMHSLEVPRPKTRENRARTGFSFYRFAIPKLNGNRGRALYLDADMLVFGDIAELWDVPFGRARVLCTNQSKAPAAWQRHSANFRPGRQMSVMMLDCGRLDWHVGDIIEGLDAGRYDYRQLMFDLCIVDPDEIEERIAPEWNCLEWYEPARTRLLHYTVVPSQPWKNDQNPLRHLWEDAFRDALAAGAVSPEEVRQGIAQGHLKPAMGDDLALAPQAEDAPQQAYRPWTRVPWHQSHSPAGRAWRKGRRVFRKLIRKCTRTLRYFAR
jgi:hypothetical protein